MADSSTPGVLVVEDEADVATTYDLWLSDSYDVTLAESGQEALDVIDEDVDVVLLDRMMPGMSGDEVLSEIRDREYDCQVAMVTAVDPDFDIVEMGFDDYVTKPPTRGELREVVEELLDRDELADTVREYRALVAKRAALRAEKTDEELERSDAYAELNAEIGELKAELDGSNDRFLDDAEFVGALRDLTGEVRGGDDP